MSDNIDFKITGLDALSRRLIALGPRANRILEQALYQKAEMIIAESKEDYVPVDLGALRSSGFVEKPVGTGKHTSITLGFGGPAAPYAMVVHEDMQAEHKVGSAKYLSIPFNKAKGDFKSYLVGKLKAIK